MSPSADSFRTYWDAAASQQPRAFPPIRVGDATFVPMSTAIDGNDRFSVYYRDRAGNEMGVWVTRDRSDSGRIGGSAQIDGRIVEAEGNFYLGPAGWRDFGQAIDEAHRRERSFQYPQIPGFPGANGGSGRYRSHSALDEPSSGLPEQLRSAPTGRGKA